MADRWAGPLGRLRLVISWCRRSERGCLKDMTRIALIHATPAAVGPIKDAFAEAWPEPDLVNLLDDSLSRDRALTARR